jgi:hypothetical protein
VDWYVLYLLIHYLVGAVFRQHRSFHSRNSNILIALRIFLWHMHREEMLGTNTWLFLRLLMMEYNIQN